MITQIQRFWLFGLFLFALSATPVAAGEPWRLVQAVGEVSAAAPGRRLEKAAPVQVLPDGAMVATGATGRAVLVRGRESIVMAPGSKLTLPANANLKLKHVKQDSGVLLFRVGKQPQAHFEVQTPYLAAVVKGTTFSVKVGASGASVHVLEGAVEVATPDRSRAFLTQAGQISSVFTGAANDIFTAGAAAMSQFDPGVPANVLDIDRLDPGVMARGLSEGLQAIAAPLRQSSEPAPGSPDGSARGKPGPEAVRQLRGAEKAPDKRPAKGAAQDAVANVKAESKAAAGEPLEAVADRTRTARTLRLGGMRGQIAIDGMAVEVEDPQRPQSLTAGSWMATGRDGGVSFKVGTAVYALAENSAVVFDGPEGGEIPRFVSGTGCRLDMNVRRFLPVNTMAPERAEHLNRKRDQDGLMRVPVLTIPNANPPEALCAALDGPAEMARRWDGDGLREARRTLLALDKVALGVLGVAALGCIVLALYPSGSSRRALGPNGGKGDAAAPGWMKTILGR